MGVCKLIDTDVTPYVGVWIETESWIRGRTTARSLLMWECGLKRVEPVYQLNATGVTPYVGVWIETPEALEKVSNELSLLMWECGLKHPSFTVLLVFRGHSLCGSVD